jgi:hypothetical protein
MFVQQVHYWLQKSEHIRDGRKWIYNTYEEWHEQFPFWSEQVIRKRIVKPLEDQGILVTTDEYNRMSKDKTKWYTIDYDAVNALFESPDKITSDTGQSNHPKTGQNNHTNNQRLPESNNRDKDTNVSSRGNAAIASPTGSEKQKKAEEEYDAIVGNFGSLGKKLSLFVESAAQQRNKTGELRATTKLRDYAEPFVDALDTLSREQLSYGLDAAIRNKAKRFAYVLAAVEGYDPMVHERFKRGPAKPQNSIAVTNVTDSDYDVAGY